METAMVQQNVSELKAEIINDVDLALEADREELRNRFPVQTENEKLKSLPVILRCMGALVLVAAATTFLLQQWDSMNHIVRYFAFLGFTLTLGVAGFFCGLRIKEDKGARTFLAVAVAVVPVHFCQLGALIYSKVGAVTHVPALLTWVAPDLLTALVTTAIGLSALIPLTLVSFSALARSHAKVLTAIYLIANVSLLIPTRVPGLIGVLALVTFLGVAFFERERFAGEPSLQTKEGLLVRGLLYAPVALMIGRSMNLYAIDQLFLSMLNAIIAIALFRFVPQRIEDHKDAATTQSLAIWPAMLAQFYLASALIEQFSINADMRIPLTYLPMSVILLTMSLCSLGSGSGYRKSAVLLAIITVIAELVIYPGTAASFLCVFTGMLTAAYGYTAEEKASFVLGLLGLGAGLGYHIKSALELASISPWLSLAIVGIVTVIASSYLERYYRAIVQRINTFKSNMATWN